MWCFHFLPMTEPKKICWKMGILKSYTNLALPFSGNINCHVILILTLQTLPQYFPWEGNSPFFRHLAWEASVLHWLWKNITDATWSGSHLLKTKSQWDQSHFWWLPQNLFLKNKTKQLLVELSFIVLFSKIRTWKVPNDKSCGTMMLWKLWKHGHGRNARCKMKQFPKHYE